MSITVLLADDQALVRAGSRMILETEPDIEVVRDAADGHEAVRRARALLPDVVLMDIRMPELDGLAATRQLATGGHSPRVLILTTYDLDEDVYEALRGGASGFLLKDAPPEDLVAAVRVVAAGEALLAPSVTRRLIEEFARTAARPAVGSPVGLTEREVDVWRAVARGLSDAEVARELFIAESTVKTHVSRLLTKLGLRDRAQAVVAAYEHGIVRPGVGGS